MGGRGNGDGFTVCESVSLMKTLEGDLEDFLRAAREVVQERSWPVTGRVITDAHQVLSDPMANDDACAISPDRKHVTLSRTWSQMVLGFDETADAIAKHMFEKFYEPGSPWRGAVLELSWHQLYLGDLDSDFGIGDARLMSAGEPIDTPTFSPDGQSIAFFEGRIFSCLWVLDMVSGTRRCLGTPPPNFSCDRGRLSYSSDGCWLLIAYATPGWGDFRLIDLNDGRIIRLPHHEWRDAAWFPAASPSTLITIEQEDSGLALGTFDLSTGTSERIGKVAQITDLPLDWTQSSVSEDGRFLLGLTHGGRTVADRESFGIRPHVGLIDLDSNQLEVPLPLDCKTTGAEFEYGDPRWVNESRGSGPTRIADSLLELGTAMDSPHEPDPELAERFRNLQDAFMVASDLAMPATSFLQEAVVFGQAANARDRDNQPVRNWRLALAQARLADFQHDGEQRQRSLRVAVSEGREIAHGTPIWYGADRLLDLWESGRTGGESLAASWRVAMKVKPVGPRQLPPIEDPWWQECRISHLELSDDDPHSLFEAAGAIHDHCLETGNSTPRLNGMGDLAWRLSEMEMTGASRDIIEYLGQFLGGVGLGFEKTGELQRALLWMERALSVMQGVGYPNPHLPRNDYYESLAARRLYVFGQNLLMEGREEQAKKKKGFFRR